MTVYWTKVLEMRFALALLFPIATLVGCVAPKVAVPEQPAAGIPTLSTAVVPTAGPTAQGRAPSTPELIEQAVSAGELSAAEGILYLAYAAYEYESLPVQYRSNTRWDGTLAVRKIKEAAASPAVLCAFPVKVQSELRRLIRESADCAP